MFIERARIAAWTGEDAEAWELATEALSQLQSIEPQKAIEIAW
jgi:hypothetical protein